MDRGRSNGVGGSKGLVAGVKAALRPRSTSTVKSHSKSQLQVEEEENIKQRANSFPSSMSSKSHRSPKSPFMGWKRSRSKEKGKKDKTNNKYNPPQGLCSQSQAERLSSHISDDYPSYGSDASEMLRDIRTGKYTSFLNHSDGHERSSSRISNPQLESAPLVSGVDLYVTDSESCGKETDFYVTDSRYVNLPTSCFGGSCVRYSKNSDNSFSVNEENSFENAACYGNGMGAYEYNGNIHSQIIHHGNENTYAKMIYETNRSGEGQNYNRDSYGDGRGVSLYPWSGRNNNYQGTLKIDEGQDSISSEEVSSCAVRVSGDGSEAQDLISTEVKIEEEIKVGSPSPTLGKRQSWLKSALTYNLEVPEFPRNEVVVLALGIDQYIEEVFRYLDHSGTGKIHVEDFKALCNVLGLGNKEDEDDKSRTKRCQCMGSNLTLKGSLNNSVLNDESIRDHECPVHLSFAEFHDRLCESFVRGAKTESVIPLASRRPGNPRLVTSVVQVQRRYDVLENIAKCLDEVSAGLDADENKMIAECPASGVVCCKCQQSAHVDKNSNISLQPMDSESAFLQKQVLLQQQELQCLREVIEDMRIALQCSDAENLALQVKTLRSGGPSREASLNDLSLTDEEDTIDDLVNQLKALSRPARISPTEDDTKQGNKNDSTFCHGTKSEVEGPNTSEDPLNTAFLSGDYSLEKELQATYEALQAAREEREATQADLQRVVGELQERERDLHGAELSLRAAHTALEKVQYDNQALVMELAETRGNLEGTRTKLLETTENLQQARESILEKERQLKDVHIKLNLLRNSRERVVDCVCSARNLVAGSLDQVRAGEQALHSLSSAATYPFYPDILPQTKPPKFDASCRADSGLYSEESEREDDRKSPERSTGHNSASEDDLWLPSKSKENLKESLRNNSQIRKVSSSSSCSLNSPSSNVSEFDNNSHFKCSSSLVINEIDPSAMWPKKPANGLTSNSTEIIEGLEKELQDLQLTLDEAEKEWKQERVYHLSNEEKTKAEYGILEDELREVEAERMRLALIEEKLRQLLQVLVSVADLNLSRRTLGRLVLEAVEDTAGIKLGDFGFGDSNRGEGKVSPITFLSNLLSSAANYQALSTESLLHLAFEGLSFPPCIPELPEPIEATLG